MPARLEKAGCHWGCGQLPERLIHHSLAVSHAGSRSAVEWHAVSASGLGREWERGSKGEVNLPLLFVVTILIQVKDRQAFEVSATSPPETTHATSFRDLGLWKGMAVEAADLGSGSDSTT